MYLLGSNDIVAIDRLSRGGKPPKACDCITRPDLSGLFIKLKKINMMITLLKGYPAEHTSDAGYFFGL